MDRVDIVKCPSCGLNHDHLQLHKLEEEYEWAGPAGLRGRVSYPYVVVCPTTDRAVYVKITTCCKEMKKGSSVPRAGSADDEFDPIG